MAQMKMRKPIEVQLQFLNLEAMKLILSHTLLL